MAVGLQAARMVSKGIVTRNVTRTDWIRAGRAHLVGIGGSGMRALARVLAGRGWGLSGSDVAADGLVGVLPDGTRLFCGHDAAHVPADVDMVVYSDAIGRDNPELLAARASCIPALSYFDTVGRLMDGAHGLAVAGTHGKSTTTAMAAWILTESGRDPTVLCGGAIIGQADGGRAGRDRLVLAEACEYRENFLKLRPRHAVILDIEPDHFDCYPEPADVECAFRRFAGAIAPDGLLLAHAGCDATRHVAAAALCRVETFGLAGACDWLARVVDQSRGCHRWDLVYRSRVLCRIAIPMPGRHNVINALAAAALAWHQGVEPEHIAGLLGRFPGVRRRLESLGTHGGITVIDDFAHHPTELTATLKTVRQMYPHRRICVVFQPHQVSRTTHYLDELAASLHNGLRRRVGTPRGDRLWIAEIFRAREGLPSPGEVTSADLAARVRCRGHDVACVYGMDDIALDLGEEVRSGDVLLLIGAGDIRRILDRGPLADTMGVGRPGRVAVERQ